MVGYNRLEADPGRDFRARPPWWGGDLQTIRNSLLDPLFRAPQGKLAPGEIAAIPVSEGDRLRVVRHAPQGAPPRAWVLLVHGLTGCEDSLHVLSAARTLIEAGYGVVRLNLRGAGPSRTQCRGHYHAGQVDDLACVVAWAKKLTPKAPVAALGFSLGGTVLLNLLGEAGAGSGIDSAMAISSPLDLFECAVCMLRWRNVVYHRWLLGRMRKEALGGEVSPAEREAIGHARSIAAFDHGFIAPRFGYHDVATYYRCASPLPRLSGVRTPSLLLHAQNDPWVPAHPAQILTESSGGAYVAIVTNGGGHVGFHEAGHVRPLSERLMLAWFAQSF